MNTWRKCSVCKTEIPLNGKYYQCSVSTCNGKSTGLVFCSVSCFERHLPGARHKDAAAIESKAPSQSPQEGGQRRIVVSSSKPSPSAQTSLGAANSNEILVVVSKLKKYVQDRAEMNTAQSVANVLSDKIRRLCDEAIQEARKDGRKTLMDRDFK